MRPFSLILDHEDPRVDAYRDLQDDAAVRRHGFIAQSWVVLERAIAQGRYPLSSVLLSDKQHLRLSPLLQELGPEVALYVAGQAVMDRTCGFPVHRGVLAHARSPELPAASDLLASLGPETLVVCAVGVNDIENMGAIFRNAAAFGAAAVLLDPTCCDPLFRRAIRVSVGAALTMPFARLQPGEDLLALLHQHALEPVALSPSGNTSLKALSPTSRTAVLVGAEGPGLPQALLAHTRTVRIPMAGGFDSLNVATALAVALHQLQGDADKPRGR